MSPRKGWDAASIKEALERAGLRLVEADRLAGVPKGSSSQALRRGCSAGEEAVSKALNIPLFTLFPNRYNADGSRKRPLPRSEYCPKRRFAKHQKDTDVQTGC